MKVQVEFNPARVTAYRQIGYAKHQLTKEQFRDNTVAAAQIGAAESGNALYVVAVNPAGNGPLGTVRVRFRVPGTSDVPRARVARALHRQRRCRWTSPAPPCALAATASAFSEWLASSPYAGEVTPDRLLGYLSGVPGGLWRRRPAQETGMDDPPGQEYRGEMNPTFQEQEQMNGEAQRRAEEVPTVRPQGVHLYTVLNLDTPTVTPPDAHQYLTWYL